MEELDCNFCARMGSDAASPSTEGKPAIVDHVQHVASGKLSRKLLDCDVIEHKQHKLMKVAKEFEETFAVVLWDIATKDVIKDEGIGGPIYRSWLNAEHAKMLAPNLGLADNVYRKLVELQSVESKKK